MAKRHHNRSIAFEPAPPIALRARRFDADGMEMAVLWFPLPGGDQAAELTPAEHEIVDALLAGKQNSEIAHERRTATRTVANQVAAIYRKLGVSSRAELMARAALLGGLGASVGDDA
jgi:DNA-binding NarL/FixJ family response regulator